MFLCSYIMMPRHHDLWESVSELKYSGGFGTICGTLWKHIQIHTNKQLQGAFFFPDLSWSNTTRSQLISHSTEIFKFQNYSYSWSHVMSWHSLEQEQMALKVFIWKNSTKYYWELSEGNVNQWSEVFSS